MAGIYSNNVVDQYRKTSINTASPVELIVMLYDGALRFLSIGKDAMAQKNYDKQNTYLNKAQMIISELMTSLDMKQGGEVAANLFSLYTFCLNQLIDANINDKPEPIDNVAKILNELRDAWVQIQNQTDLPAPQAPKSTSRIQLEG